MEIRGGTASRLIKWVPCCDNTIVTIILLFIGTVTFVADCDCDYTSNEPGKSDDCRQHRATNSISSLELPKKILPLSCNHIYNVPLASTNELVSLRKNRSRLCQLVSPNLMTPCLVSPCSLFCPSLMMVIPSPVSPRSLLIPSLVSPCSLLSTSLVSHCSLLNPSLMMTSLVSPCSLVISSSEVCNKAAIQLRQ